MGGFRMEEVQWRSSSSKAKILGTIASIAGAFVVTFYKGQPIMLLSSSHPPNLFSSKSNWVLGGLFLAADSFSSSLWYILQVMRRIIESLNYPFKSSKQRTSKSIN